MTARRPLVLVDGQFRQLPAGDTLEAAQGFFSLVTVTATTSGQTSFTIPGGYTPGAVVVFLNGSSLAPAHYAATNGTAIVLASGAGIVAGSELVVLRLTAFEVADALPLAGTAADSSKLGGVLAAEFYRRANILGTVSQSGGVPTGAIVERGSNANGEYVRYADGTQECWNENAGSLTADQASGSFFRSPDPATWLYPAAFHESYPVSGFAGAQNPARWAGWQTSRTQMNFRHYQPISGTTLIATETYAIGRWF